ncbi:MAG: type II and III secretion system protein [Kiritimatiellae bacterium]|nr:type II and III secretion system protein [Kiritimatiellia bacterium]MDW8458992.1 hypothetical protein [Verrucomicrobiota bacterium]
MVALLLVAQLAAAQATSKLEIYPLNGADPQTVLEAVRFVIGPEGNATVDPSGQRLLVISTPERHALVADLMKKFAPPPRNVLIEVQIVPAARVRESGAAIEASGSIVLERTEGLGAVRFRPRVYHHSSTHSSSITQTLLVGSGRESSLAIGEEVPYLDWLLQFASDSGVIQSRVEWQRVGAFLNVQPVILGEGPEIRLRITPELRRRDGGHPARIRFAALSTDIIARDGETVRIGGLGQHSEFYSRFLVGMSGEQQIESLEIYLTPRIQPTHPPLPGGRRRAAP